MSELNSNLRNHIITLSKSNLRLDGRTLTEIRQPIVVETPVSKTAEGMARVLIGETEVMAGVKVEIGSPYPDTPEEGTLIVGAELLPMSNPEFELGPPGIKAIELARVVDRGIRESKAIDFKKLCISKEEKKVWNLLVDICTINDAGNLLDASGLAVLAALKSVKFPRYDETFTIDYQKRTDKCLEIENLPLPVTVLKIGDKYIVDPTIEEEMAYDVRLTVTTLEDGTLCALQKGGEGYLSADEITLMVDLASEKAKELRKFI